MRSFLVSAVLSLVLCPFVAAQSADTRRDQLIAIRAATILTPDGPAIDGGVILIRDGKIEAAGKGLAVPDGARVIDASDAVVTPGLIDACSLVDPEIPANFYTGGFDAPSLSRRDARNNALLRTDVARRDNPLWREPPGMVAAAAGELELEDYWSRLAQGRPSHQHRHGQPAWPHAQKLDPADVDPASDAGCTPACAGASSDHSHAEDMAVGLANSRMTWAEHGAEVTPHCRVIDTVNLLSNDFARLLRGGVTTVYVSPDPASVIGSRGAIVRTGGDLSKRIIDPDAGVKATMGLDPCRRGRGNMIPRGAAASTISFHIRRPNTRMGVEFVFRKAFYDAIADGEGRPLHGADSPPAAALPILREVLAGKQSLRIQARKSHDILTALRLAREFKLNVVLDEVTEAYQVLPELKSSGAKVIYGPIFATAPGFRQFVGESDEPRLDTAARLRDAGIPFALTAQEMRDEEGLARQAMVAVANGLTTQEALAAVTSAPAEILGLGKRLGTIKPGLDADLVVWSGPPFAATSRARVVVVGGQVVIP